MQKSFGTIKPPTGPSSRQPGLVDQPRRLWGWRGSPTARRRTCPEIYEYVPHCLVITRPRTNRGVGFNTRVVGEICCGCSVPQRPALHDPSGIWTTEYPLQCNACKCASWRFIGGIREFERRYGEGAVLCRAQRRASALIGGRLGDMTDSRDLIYRRSPQEAAARRKRIYGSTRYKPRQSGEMTWVEYKAQMERAEAARKLEPVAGKPRKRRAGPGCRYKPAAPKWKPGLRDVDTTFRGSSWSA
jgi:hypothetical protein